MPCVRLRECECLDKRVCYIMRGRASAVLMCVCCAQAEAARTAQAAAQAKLGKAEDSAASAAQKLKVSTSLYAGASHECPAVISGCHGLRPLLRAQISQVSTSARLFE